jgi:uncharacterized glyoxalase superfamily protein PhnB
MPLRKLTPNLLVENVNETVRWYKEVLGFETVMTAPDVGKFVWALARRGGVEIMFQLRASLVEEYPQLSDEGPGGALTLYIDSDDVKRLYQEVAPKCPPIRALNHTFYGKDEFAIIDCNGFILVFAG